MMTNPPGLLDGAQVLRVSDVSAVRSTGRTRHVVGGRDVGAPAALVIATYADADGVYLFHCDHEWNVLADTYHETEEEALDQARFEFGDVVFINIPH